MDDGELIDSEEYNKDGNQKLEEFIEDVYIDLIWN